MLAAQSEVIDVIFDPDTPGGLRASMDCKIVSSSATAEVMMTVLLCQGTQLRQTYCDHYVKSSRNETLVAIEITSQGMCY